MPVEAAPDEHISVVIVEDHPLFRKGLRAQFDSDPAIEVIGEFGTAEEAVRGVLDLRPTVVLMDLRLPWKADARTTYCGAKAIALIRQEWPEANIAVIASLDGDKQRVHEALTAGARSFATKAGELQDLVQVVRLTAQGTAVLHPEVSEILAGFIPVSVNTSTHFSVLGTRESEQLALAAAGDSDRQIAERLGISVKTVANYWSSIKPKLGVSTREEAVELARGPGEPG